MERSDVNAGSGLEAGELEAIDALWRAANYLSVGQIYLLDNQLLRRPLVREHIKPRLLGHWGTTLQAKVHVPSIFRSMAVAITVGVLFGWYPARRASLLDPIEARRHE